MTTDIRNLVFDVGGVLLGYRWEDMLTKDHGMAYEDALVFGRTIFDDPLWLEFDYENIPFDEVVERYCAKYPHWEKDIRWMMENTGLMQVKRPDVWDLFPRLRESGYRIYLLSNYSSVLFARHTAGASFLKYIDGAVVSYMIHKIKPNREIYEYLLDKYGLNAGECLFFDDRPTNVQGAIDCGMQAFRVTDEASLIDEIKLLIG